MMLFYVLPAFGEALEGMQGQMPWLSRELLAFSAWVRAYEFAVLALAAAGIVCAFLLWQFTLRTTTGRYAVDYCKLRLPVVNRLFATSAMARFTHTLGLLLSARAELVESLYLAASVGGNSVLERAVRDATDRVLAGERISDSLKRTGYFSNSYCWLLGVAEERGNIADSLLQIADTYEHAAERQARLLIWWIGPLLILFIALVLGLIAVAIYQPVLGLTSIGDAIS
jgi:type II secretory pathway component PulF